MGTAVRSSRRGAGRLGRRGLGERLRAGQAPSCAVSRDALRVRRSPERRARASGGVSGSPPPPPPIPYPAPCGAVQGAVQRRARQRCWLPQRTGTRPRRVRRHSAGRERPADAAHERARRPDQGEVARRLATRRALQEAARDSQVIQHLPQARVHGQPRFQRADSPAASWPSRKAERSSASRKFI